MKHRKLILSCSGFIVFGVGGLFVKTLYGKSISELREGQDIIAEIKTGNFAAVIDKEEEGSMRVKKQYKTPEVKEALYQLLINPPKGFVDQNEGIDRVYLLRIMGDINEIRAIPYLIKRGDRGVAMSLGRLGEDALRVLIPELKKKENDIPASYAVALNEMTKKDDVGYVKNESSRKEVRKYLLRAIESSDEIGQKYAVRGLGEFAIQGDTEATKVIEDLSNGIEVPGKTRDLSVKIEAAKVISKLKAKGVRF